MVDLALLNKTAKPLSRFVRARLNHTEESPNHNYAVASIKDFLSSQAPLLHYTFFC